MSFVGDVRNELARIEPEKKCCMLAEISGFLRVAGSIRLAGLGKFVIVITTENPATARHYKKLFGDYFGIETSLEISQGRKIGKSGSAKKHLYSIKIDADNLSEQILRETGILMIKEGRNYISDGIYRGVISTKCCRKAYLRGLFLGAGTMSDPEKGYHLEFYVASEILAGDIKKLINSFEDLSCKVTQRGDKFVVYIKKADYIRDTLAIMGANMGVLSIEETRIKKSMINSARRSTNCDNANMDRTIDASMKQVEAIKKIDAIKGLDILSDKLSEVARLRLKHPEATISALGEMCEPPLKKSGINNRLKRIEEIASKL